MQPAAGIGLKPEHFTQAMAHLATAPAAGLWFEVHAENYMVDGGPRLAMLEQACASAPLSLHGVGMSLAGDALPDPDHLAALKRLVDRFEPALVSEHLAWSRLGDRYFPDLLPFPRTGEALARVVRNVDMVQQTLGREILIENPSHYIDLAGHGWSEIDFLSELARRTGCGLLLDINNVAVSAHNLHFDADAWLEAFPASLVGEIHLAGHSSDANLDLLIDSHDAPVSTDVWGLLARFIGRSGSCPILIERDGKLPDFATLIAERDCAAAMLTIVDLEKEEVDA
jgi:uncharacterized protein (UPF0276 family)